MVVVETVVQNKYGFHVRPSTRFMQLAKRFRSGVRVETGGLSADGKSIMELMTLGAARGSSLAITAEGPDEAEAAAALKQLVDESFGGIE